MYVFIYDMYVFLKTKIYLMHLYQESITTPPSCSQRIKAISPVVDTIKIDSFRTIPVCTRSSETRYKMKYSPYMLLYSTRCTCFSVVLQRA